MDNELEEEDIHQFHFRDYSGLNDYQLRCKKSGVKRKYKRRKKVIPDVRLVTSDQSSQQSIGHSTGAPALQPSPPPGDPDNDQPVLEVLE